MLFISLEKGEKYSTIEKLPRNLCINLILYYVSTILLISLKRVGERASDCFRRENYKQQKIESAKNNNFRPKTL